MTFDEPNATASPWHGGERHLQEKAGVAEHMDVFGRKVIRDYMPDQHRQFYAQLPFLIVGAVDNSDRPWASVLEGPVGFAYSPDPTHLRLNAQLASTDPAWEGVHLGKTLGLLGIELHTRRRNRVNGEIIERDAQGLTVQVQHAFGNCPKYIQMREFHCARESVPLSQATADIFPTLDAAASELIRSADTFFVASYAETAPARYGVDVSHRGGRPGFVRVEGNTLTIPDFAGNKHFNTLGNLLVNARAGLLFIDFSNGDVLQLTGTTELLFDGPDVQSFEGAERAWKLHVTQVVRRRNALGLRWIFKEMSPKNLLTGTWNQATITRNAE